jgi:hypothetical protein
MTREDTCFIWVLFVKKSDLFFFVILSAFPQAFHAELLLLLRKSNLLLTLTVFGFFEGSPFKPLPALLVVDIAHNSIVSGERLFNANF